MSQDHAPRRLLRLLTALSLRWERRLGRLSATVRLPENSVVLVVAAVIGLLAGAGAIVLNALIRRVQDLGYGIPDPSIAHLTTLPWWLFLILPTVGGFIVGFLVEQFAPEAKGHGVPEVMEAVALRGGLIRKRVSVAKAVASAVTIGTGGSTGREGPIIQIGAAVGSTIGRYVGLSPQRIKVYVACGAAGGIAAAFNAPLAGAIFAAEIILADFAVPRLGPVVVAAVSATAVARTWFGNNYAFTVPGYDLRSAWEFIPYLLLGLICGLTSLAFIRLLTWWEDRFDDLGIPNMVKPAIGGLILGGLSLLTPRILGIGYESISDALLGRGAWYFLIALAAAKLLSTTITLGSGASGGIFAPSLFMGATVGGAVGQLAHMAFPGIIASPGAYALVGMGGVVAGTTHAPITAILILFEMTGNYKIILPLMFTCVGSLLLSSRLYRNSIYTEKLARKGINLSGGRDLNLLKAHRVGEVMRDDAETVAPTASLDDLLDMVVESPHAQFFVQDGEGHLLGVIHAAELRKVLFDRNLPSVIIAQDLVEPCTLYLHPEDTLDRAMRLFGQSSQDEIPVLDRLHPDRLLGCVTRSDAIRAYNRAVSRLDVAGEIAAASTILGRVREVSVSEGFRLLELEAPTDFQGKTLRKLDLPSRHGVQILLVRRRQGGGHPQPVQPRADLVVEPGDHLVLGGAPEAISAFQER